MAAITLVQGAYRLFLALQPGEPWSSGLWTALFVNGAATVIFLAGLSDGLGTQSVTLLVNRITPLRFALNLLLSGILYVAVATLWMAAIWLLANRVFGVNAALADVIVVVSAAFVPLWFSALVLLPLIGPIIGWALNLWSLVTAVVAVDVAFAMPLWQSLACAGAGWLVMQVARWLLRRPGSTLGGWVWQITTGQRHPIDPRQLPPVLVEYAPLPTTEDARR
jgi:hypothetical protein